MKAPQNPTTSTQSSTRCSRVAVTGFYAHYFTHRHNGEAKGEARFQFFASRGNATLRDALRCHHLQIATTANDKTLAIDALSLDANEQVGFIVRELKICALWDAQKRVLNVDGSRVGISFSASKNNFDSIFPQTCLIFCRIFLFAFSLISQRPSQ